MREVEFYSFPIEPLPALLSFCRIICSCVNWHLVLGFERSLESCLLKVILETVRLSAAYVVDVSPEQEDARMRCLGTFLICLPDSQVSLLVFSGFTHFLV